MRNQTKRNRKIGATQGGRVKDGRAVEKLSHRNTQDLWTRLSEDNIRWKVIKENPSRHYYHPCNEKDYHYVLTQLPEEVTDCVNAIILRRAPKNDENLGIEARRRYFCVIMNSFPKSRTISWQRKPRESVLHHYNPWCRRWEQDGPIWNLIWEEQEIRRYYLYHLFLHEIGHLNQPVCGSRKQHEMFAENFALEWARKLGKHEA